jgi:hypothetical protein
VELLMLSSAAAVVGGLYIGTQASKDGADATSKIGTWSGALVMELLAVVPFLCALPALFHELAHSRLLHPLRASKEGQVNLQAREEHQQQFSKICKEVGDGPLRAKHLEHVRA